MNGEVEIATNVGMRTFDDFEVILCCESFNVFIWCSGGD
jgi:hypothetical protein